MGGDGEGQAHVHAAGIMLERRIEKALDFGEGHNFVELAADFGLLHAQDGAAEENVFASGKLEMEAGADFEQGCRCAREDRRSRPWGG